MIAHVGLIKTTLLDFPGHVAATLFTHGCPLRCPYCHNPELVRGPIPDHFLPIETAMAHLERRRGVLDGVCLTGGEPLIHPDLPDLIARIRSLGLRVKLDTSGALPGALQKVLNRQLLDYVALDFKTDPALYHRVGGNGATVVESLRMIQASGIDHEIRTTVCPGIVDHAGVQAIAALLNPQDRYVLAQFRPTITLDEQFAAVVPYDDRTLVGWCNELRQKKRRCYLRGVEEIVAKGLEPLTERI